MSFTWGNWAVEIWPTGENEWGWTAARYPAWLSGDATGSLAQVKLLLSAKLRGL